MADLNVETRCELALLRSEHEAAKVAWANEREDLLAKLRASDGRAASAEARCQRLTVQLDPSAPEHNVT